MDPLSALSVIASITGMLAVTAKLTNLLTDFIKKERNAPSSITTLNHEISDLSICLLQLQPFIRGNKLPTRSRRAAITVEQVVVIVTACVINLSRLEEILDTFRLDQPLSTLKRIQWTRKETEVDRLMAQIRASRTSLNFILTIFSCTTSEEVQESVNTLTTIAHSLLTGNEDISRRLATMEASFPNQAKSTTTNTESLYRLRARRLSASSNPNQYPRTSSTSETISASSPSEAPTKAQAFSLVVELELQRSRVYLRALRRHSASSLLSSNTNSKCGWSMLSDVSLAQISDISVLSLPISASELWNREHYKASSTSRLSSTYDDRAAILKSLRKVLIRPASSSDRPSLDIGSPQEPEVKMLLLGISGSGKSTIQKNLRMIWEGNPIEEGEREAARQILCSNVIEAFQEIGAVSCDHEFESQHECSYEYLPVIQNAGYVDIFLDSRYNMALEKLWDEATVKAMTRRGAAYALLDNLAYGMNNRNRLSQSSQITNEDLLHTRVKSTGIHETLLRSDRINYRVFDPSGATVERRKWSKVSTDAQCIVFVVPMNSYNVWSDATDTTTEVSESLILFKATLSRPEFLNTKIVLMMNKVDLFKQKINQIPINNFWPDFEEPELRENIYDAALQFFTQKFLAADERKDRVIQVYYTNAVDTATFKETMRSIEDVLLTGTYFT